MFEMSTGTFPKYFQAIYLPLCEYEISSFESFATKWRLGTKKNVKPQRTVFEPRHLKGRQHIFASFVVSRYKKTVCI